jgi:hypothetical protein
MGFLGPEQMLLKDLAVETNFRSNVMADHGKFSLLAKKACSLPAAASRSEIDRVGDQRRP